jgi:hypothetical protein
MERKPLCPLLHIWRQIYTVLEEAYERAGVAEMPPPPLVFNMQGWQLSTDSQKEQRWVETRAWAEQHGFARLIGHLSDDEFYDGE